MSKEESATLASEIAGNIVKQNKGPEYQVVEASYTAFAADIAAYDATLAATTTLTSNKDLAKVSTFTSCVTASAISAVDVVTTPNVSNKTLLLLEPTAFPSDKLAIKTFNYYWDKYPELFEKIQIVYTDIDENGNSISDNNLIIENNIKYLNEYYNKGYRLFLGFTVSSILVGVLPWFNTIGKEAQGISLNSTSSSLNIPKPVYRLKPNNKLIVDGLDFIFSKASKIYYVYSNQLASADLIPYLKKYDCELFLFPVNDDSSNLTLENIKEFYKDTDENSISITWLFIGTNQTDFINLFNDSYPLPITTYNILLSNLPQINESSKNAFVNKYNFLYNISFSTSELFRNGLDNLKSNFSTYVPNALLLINNICLTENINSLPSENSVLEFNENNDIKYYTFLNTIYSKDDKGNYYYKEDFYSLYDPIVGKQIFYLNN
jgi:hypothetical protein